MAHTQHMKAKQLMSFQSYVETLSNNLDELTACKKYRDFMADLTQSKEGRFFEINKDREWFRLKYHPIESQKFFQEQNANFLNRLKIFNELNDRNYFDNLSYTSNNSSRILNLMDGITIYLESGPQELVDQLIHHSAVDNNLKSQYIPTKPNSLVISDLNIETTVAEIQELCAQANPGVVRIASLDPYYVAGGALKRKVVVIYKLDVDIKEVCWILSRMRLNNRLLNVSINKCLTNRIQSVNAISNHHMCIVNDIRSAFILILNFDELKGLYGKRRQILDSNITPQTANETNGVKMEVDSVENITVKEEPMEHVAPMSPPGSDKSINGEDEDDKPFDVSSLDEDKEKEKKKLLEFRFNIDLSLYRQSSKFAKNNNPVLVNATEFLIDYIDSSAARHQLSKIFKDLLAEPAPMEIDDYLGDKTSLLKFAVENLFHSLEQSTRILDKMLWYLRIVHSFDFYKKALYKHEDELTSRMGVIHLRGDPAGTDLASVNLDDVKSYLSESDQKFQEFGYSQTQKFVTKDEERFNYKSYGKVITDELASYSQRIQKPKSNGTEEVYKCKHCTRVFQKLTDIGRHFVSKHRWAIDAIELETDFFNAYLFDAYKINPCPPKELLDVPRNRFANLTNNISEMGEDPELLKQTIEAYSKMDAMAREPAPRVQIESDPRNEIIADYNDISFDDAI